MNNEYNTTIKTSEETNALFKALALFQKEVAQPKKDANNPFFKSKYVPLENVVDVIHNASAKLGLYEATYPAQQDGLVGVGVIITHESGQYIQYPPVLLRPSKNDPQGYGAAMTYARRYALSAAFGIASETDDDANSISTKQQKEPTNKPETIKPFKKPTVAEATKLANLYGDRVDKMLEFYKVEAIIDMHQDEVRKLIKREERKTGGSLDDLQ